MAIVGMLVLGVAWPWVLGIGGAAAMLAAVGRRTGAPAPAPYATDAVPSPQATGGQSRSARKAARRKAAASLAEDTPLAASSDDDRASPASAVDLRNSFALLDPEAAPAPTAPKAPLRPAPAREVQLAPLAPVVTPAPAAHTSPRYRADGRPKRCEISRSVPDYGGDAAILEAVQSVPVSHNPVLDAILEGQLVTRHGSALAPGESCVRGTADGGRYEFELVRHDPQKTELYQYALHFDRNRQGMMRINKRRVVLTWA